MTRFIQQRLFDVGAATVARIHRVGTNLDDAAERMAQGYRSDYADEDLSGKWRAAAIGALDVLYRFEVPESLGNTILVSFDHFAKTVDRDGRKLSVFKRFGGTLFHYESAPIPDLVGTFIRRFAAYAAMGKQGILRKEWVE